jgi:hypothetical protein
MRSVRTGRNAPSGIFVFPSQPNGRRPPGGRRVVAMPHRAFLFFLPAVMAFQGAVAKGRNAPSGIFVFPSLGPAGNHGRRESRRNAPSGIFVFPSGTQCRKYCNTGGRNAPSGIFVFPSGICALVLASCASVAMPYRAFLFFLPICFECRSSDLAYAGSVAMPYRAFLFFLLLVIAALALILAVSQCPIGHFCFSFGYRKPDRGPEGTERSQCPIGHFCFSFNTAWKAAWTWESGRNALSPPLCVEDCVGHFCFSFVKETTWFKVSVFVAMPHPLRRAARVRRTASAGRLARGLCRAFLFFLLAELEKQVEDLNLVAMPYPLRCAPRTASGIFVFPSAPH